MRGKKKIEPKTKEDPLLIMQATLNSLQSKIAYIEKEITKLNRKTRQHSVEISNCQLFADSKNLATRLENINQRMLAITIKDAVCTEVARCFPDTAATLYKFQDMNDDFWIERDTWTVAKWAEFALNKKEERQ